MKLEYLYIDGYKGLKRLKLQFKEQTGAVPVDFLIGCNGSGKSSVLEAVGLIFTRIMQNELPDFPIFFQFHIYLSPPPGSIAKTLFLGLYINSRSIRHPVFLPVLCKMSCRDQTDI